jgi:hypothetical protein
MRKGLIVDISSACHGCLAPWFLNAEDWIDVYSYVFLGILSGVHLLEMYHLAVRFV